MGRWVKTQNTASFTGGRSEKQEASKLGHQNDLTHSPVTGSTVQEAGSIEYISTARQLTVYYKPLTPKSGYR